MRLGKKKDHYTGHLMQFLYYARDDRMTLELMQAYSKDRNRRCYKVEVTRYDPNFDPRVIVYDTTSRRRALAVVRFLLPLIDDPHPRIDLN